MSPEAIILEQQFINSKPKPQVGGNHYETAIEPIEFIEANNLSFHEGSVIKYVTRYKRKNGVEDLQKAKWYIDRIIELEYPNETNP